MESPYVLRLYVYSTSTTTGHDDVAELAMRFRWRARDKKD